MDLPPSAPDEFILPKRTKKRRNNRSDLTPLSFSAKLERERASLRQDAQWLSKTLQIVRSAIEEMEWESETMDVLCLGLGSPSESRSARLQLSLVLELLAELGIPHARASFYDPVFSQEDIDGMKSLRVHIQGGEGVKEIKHSLSRETLVIMPHCDIGLYQSLLETNWTPECMQRLVILGNPLDQYSLTTEKKRLDTEFHLVKRLGNHPDWKTVAIPEAKSDEKAFVALAVQYLKASQGMESVPDIFEYSKQ